MKPATCCVFAKSYLLYIGDPERDRIQHGVPPLKTTPRRRSAHACSLRLSRTNMGAVILLFPSSVSAGFLLGSWLYSRLRLKYTKLQLRGESRKKPDPTDSLGQTNPRHAAEGMTFKKASLVPAGNPGRRRQLLLMLPTEMLQHRFLRRLLSTRTVENRTPCSVR